MISSSTILYANPNGGLPIIDPACNVISSYLRSQPTRVIFPTEIFRLQSTSIKNIIDERRRSLHQREHEPAELLRAVPGPAGSEPLASHIGGYANAKREVMAVDYGIVWQVPRPSASKTR